MDKFNECKNCCLSEKFPGADIDESGVCVFCRKHDASKNRDIVAKNNEHIEKIIEKAKAHKNSTYDVVVSYSGGKDSSYTLLHLKRYGLRVLALLIDNNFVSDGAFLNARVFTDNIFVDLLIFKINSDQMNQLYRKSLAGDFYNSSQLSRANSACLSCIKVINNLTLNEAIMRRVPLVAGGYIEGQIPKTAGTISSKFLASFRDDNSKTLAKNIDPVWEKFLANQGDAQFCPDIINPLVGLDYSEERIIAEISKYGWQKPSDTGLSSSNCLLNDYAISRHFEKHGYHPYEAEITSQVRNGTLSKWEAQKKLKDIRPSKSYDKIEKKLGIHD